MKALTFMLLLGLSTGTVIMSTSHPSFVNGSLIEEQGEKEGKVQSQRRAAEAKAKGQVPKALRGPASSREAEKSLGAEVLTRFRVTCKQAQRRPQAPR